MAEEKVQRRAVLKGLGAAAVLPVLPTGCKDDGGGTGGGGDEAPVEFGWAALRQRIDTVVVVMMENRSFDHYLGARLLEEGDERVDGLTADMSNPHPEGGEVTVFASEDYCLEDPPHSWRSCHDQFNDGANDGFVREFYDREPHVAEEAMGYYGRDTLSAMYTLADAYVVCDQWFGSLMSSTWPNRFYSMAAQNGGVQGNDFAPEAFPSIMGRLEAAGLDWATYFNNLPFPILLSDVTDLGSDHFRSFEDDFAADAAAGTLPPLTLIEPVYGRSDDHPPAHPVAGQVFLALIYDILSRSPQWERTLLIITYDEHGGFFDHVPPPTMPDARAADGFDQLGFRVPTLVVGPWVKADHVSSVVRDHTSILALLENLYELEPLTERDAAADPMLDVFDEDAVVNNTPRAPVGLDPIEADEEEIYAEECAYLDSLFLTGPQPDDFRTGQPGLEAYVKAHFPDTIADRAHRSDDLHERMVAMAMSRGLLRIRKG